MQTSDQDHSRKETWYIAQRWQEFEAESRICLLRVLMVFLFYAAQLIHYSQWGNGDVDRMFHRQATGIAAAWLFVSMGIAIALNRGFFPSWLKYAATLADLVLLSVLASLGHGPSSPLVLIYFVVIAITSLRFDLPILWCSVVGSITGYMLLVGKADTSWFDASHATPPIQQAITVLSMIGCGIALDQVLRSVRRFTREVESRTENMKNQGGLHV